MFSCSCILLLVLSMITIVHASGVQIKIGNKELIKNQITESIDVPIELSGNSGIAGMTLKLSYTDGLVLTKITQGTALNSLNLTQPGDFSANPCNLLWDGKDADNTNGTIVVLTFQVPKNEIKTYSISVTPDGVFDNDVNEINVDVISGTIAVKDNANNNDPEVATLTNTTFKTLTSTYKFNIECSQALETECLMVACYDDSNRLLTLKRIECDGDTSYNTSVPIDPNISYAKIFVWSSINNLKPIAGFEKIIINE